MYNVQGEPKTVHYAGNTGEIMVKIFKDLKDDQQEGLMETIFVGQTWQFRYLKIKALVWGSIATVSGMVATATLDYAIFKYTDYAGLLAWIMG